MEKRISRTHSYHPARLEALILVCDFGGPTMLARIGMMRVRWPIVAALQPREVSILILV
jgi:hypothetical protein